VKSLESEKMKLPGGLESTQQPSYPLRTPRPESHPAMALGEASHAGSDCVLGSEGPESYLLAHNFRRSHSTVFAADCWKAAYPPANQCFAGVRLRFRTPHAFTY
jgi:hypothetical protein